MPDAFKSEKLVLRFIKIGSDNPRISGIMIINGTLESSYYYEHVALIQKFKQLVRNKLEMSEKALQFPKDHQILTPVTVTSVLYKYPLAILFWSISLYFVLTKLIS